MKTLYSFRGKSLAKLCLVLLFLATAQNAVAQIPFWQGIDTGTSQFLITQPNPFAPLLTPVRVGINTSIPFADLAVKAGTNGSNGVIGQLQRGVFGNITPNSSTVDPPTPNQWLAIGKSPFPGTADDPYGMRINWGGDLAIFQLRQQSGGEREGTIVWGNARTTLLKFIFSNTNFNQFPLSSTDETVIEITPPSAEGREDAVFKVFGDVKANNVAGRSAAFATVQASSLKAEEFTVDKVDNLPDYVFAPDYKLMPLDELEKAIQTQRHLPNMPSAQEVAQNGMNLVEMQKRLLEKVEELTLYVIQLKKENDKLKVQIAEQAKDNSQP